MANTPAEQLPRRVAVVGLGYFSQFHLDAWQREAGAQLVAVCDRDAALATEVGEARGVPAYTALQALLADHSVDVVDIVAPPSAHATLVRAALAPGRTVICQRCLPRAATGFSDHAAFPGARNRRAFRRSVSLVVRGRRRGLRRSSPVEPGDCR